MSTHEELERRVAALEAVVAELQRRLVEAPSTAEWIKQISGSFKDDSAFQEVVRLGREFREADRPREDEEVAP